MANLLKQIRLGLTDEQKCDILYQLLDRATENGTMPDDPAAIEVGEDCTIRWDEAGHRQRNMALWPPELISTIRNGGTVEFRKEQKFYIAGMLGYLMSNGRDWFEEHSIASVDVARYANNPFVIQDSDVQWQNFAEAIAQLSSVDPAGREEGVIAFVECAYDSFPSVNEITYVCDGAAVGTEQLTLQEDLQLSGKAVKFQDSSYRVETYPVVAARPGKHAYRIPVTKVTSSHPPLTAGQSAQPWNTNLEVWSVWVSRAYLTGKATDRGSIDSIFSATDTITKIVKFQYCIGTTMMPSPRLLVFKGDPRKSNALKNQITITKPVAYSAPIYHIAFLFDRGWNYFETALLDQHKQPIGARQRHLFAKP